LHTCDIWVWDFHPFVVSAFPWRTYPFPGLLFRFKSPEPDLAFDEMYIHLATFGVDSARLMLNSFDKFFI
ncbi:hypothetical protein QMM87_18235, partial [Leptospira santarosai]|uniref:hypothetical protein n=1 Tax=Leptospira santarosai TaxID=28183 RepID=UPI0024AEBD1F